MVSFQPFDSIEPQHLEALVTNRTPESEVLEFKRELPETWNDSTRRAILREVTSLANRSGGRLIYGVEENKDGEAAALRPIPDAVRMATALIASVRDNTDHPLPIRTRVIDHQAGAAIVFADLGGLADELDKGASELQRAGLRLPST